MAWYILLQQLMNGLILGSIYGLIAIGYTMVYGIIGMINFAHGDVYMIAAYLTAIFLASLSFLGITAVPLALFCTLVVTLIVISIYGMTIERVAYRPLRNTTRLSALISAIGVSLVLQNMVQKAQGSEHQGVPNLISGVIRMGSDKGFIQISNIQLMILISTLIFMIVLTCVVKFTQVGRAMRATQEDIGMAEILGINTNKIISKVFALGAVMAGLAGFLVSLNYGSFDFYIGFVTGIKAFTAAVLGGIGSLPGAMLGGIILGMSESLFSGFVNTDYKDVFAFALLILVLIFRPSGILGKPAVKKV
jgi:branched-chain amino acid transport system permease protein